MPMGKIPHRVRRRWKEEEKYISLLESFKVMCYTNPCSLNKITWSKDLGWI